MKSIGKALIDFTSSFEITILVSLELVKDTCSPACIKPERQALKVFLYYCYDDCCHSDARHWQYLRGGGAIQCRAPK